MPEQLKPKTDMWDANRNIKHELTECDKEILAVEYRRNPSVIVNSRASKIKGS